MPEKATIEAGTQTERDPLALVRSAETHLFQAKQALENLGTDTTNSELIESSTKLGAQFEELDAALTAKRQAVYTALLKSVIALKVEMPISYKHGYAPQFIKPDGGIYYRNGDIRGGLYQP